MSQLPIGQTGRFKVYYTASPQTWKEGAGKMHFRQTRQGLKKKNSIDTEITLYTIHPFQVYNSIAFSMFPVVPTSP